MAGDFTSVPLRSGDRWTAARMQQGRVLLDTDWNLTIDGAAAVARELARDAIGPYGVLTGSNAFAVTVDADGSVHVAPGSIWVDGLLAVNPADLDISTQPEIEPTVVGNAAVYLDVFVEEVQAAEDPDELLDPALGGVDTTTRTRVGWRVHSVATDATTCATAAAVLPAGSSSGRLDVVQTAVPAPPDPCAPPDDPRVRLPDGLLRIEVLDSGTETTARFGWSYDDGSSAVAATVAGSTVTCAPSPSVEFAPGDLVEVSTLARRADRRDTGPLFSVANVAPDASGDVITLSAPSPLTGNPPGTCLRRWDGETVGAVAAIPLTLGGIDVGIAFSAHPGEYLAGDWWGVRLRGSAGDAVETRTDAAPDGVAHSPVLLGVVNTSTHVVLSDCRPTYTPLTELDRGTTCTVTAFPGDDVQAAIGRLPATGGELCLAAGTFVLPAPLLLANLQRVVVTGVGPATVLQAPGHESVVRAQDCADIEIRDLRVEASQPTATAPGEKFLLGALTFQGCQGITVRDCQIWCPDSSGRAQSGVYVTPGAAGEVSDDVVLIGNSLEIGDQQVGILVVSTATISIHDNTIDLAAVPVALKARPLRLVADELARYVSAHLELDVNPAPPTPGKAAAKAPAKTAAKKTAAKKTVAKKTVAAAAKRATRAKAVVVQQITASGSRILNLPGNASAAIGGGTPVQRLATDWAAQATQAQLAAASSPRAAFARFAMRAAVDPNALTISRASLGFIRDSLLSSRAIGQGIVVAGSVAARVDIHDNVVTQTIQGVHVGLGAGRTDLSAGQVSVSRNTVTNLVPYFWQRSRHAYYVGSFTSLTMTDNHAQLTYSGGVQALKLLRVNSGMEAVRIWGRIGTYLQVRGVDASGGYRTAVVVNEITAGAVPAGLHYVADVFNGGGGTGLVAPQWVLRERCLP
jgi:hypothetical protein